MTPRKFKYLLNYVKYFYNMTIINQFGKNIGYFVNFFFFNSWESLVWKMHFIKLEL